MATKSRRTVLLGAGATVLALAACNNSVSGNGGNEIDARVDATLNALTTEVPETNDLVSKAAGILVMPVITEAGFGIGGSFGRGALLVEGLTVDYYSAAQASIGFQIGAQQFSHVLFFMTPEALADFRTSPGWVAGANIEYAFTDRGESLLADTTTVPNPVVGVVFGQTGIRAGATIDGTKYSRIIP